MNTHEHYFRLVPLGSLFGEVHLVIVINCCVKSLLSVSVLHVSKVANATADGSNSKGHEVLVWLHIQLEIQRSEHTGGLKARMSTLSGKSQWEPPCSWFHLLLGVLWLPPLGRWAGASRVPSSTPEDLSVALVEFSCLWNLKGHAHHQDVKYFAKLSWERQFDSEKLVFVPKLCYEQNFTMLETASPWNWIFFWANVDDYTQALVIGLCKYIVCSCSSDMFYQKIHYMYVSIQGKSNSGLEKMNTQLFEWRPGTKPEVYIVGKAIRDFGSFGRNFYTITYRWCIQHSISYFSLALWKKQQLVSANMFLSKS